MIWLHRYLRFVTVCTFFLIIAGGLVTSTDSGLAVPDWPKSYGMWMPPMVGGVFYEHGHRMVASFVGLLTVVLAFWIWRSEKRKWMRRLGLIALLAVIIQGVLGGITVIFLLPMPISIAHATLAQSFFSLIVCLMIFTSNEWQLRGTEGKTSPARKVFLATSVMIYLQLILGAWVRHSGAALAIPDFPLAMGRLIPPFSSAQVAIHFAHRAGALLVTLMVFLTLRAVWKHCRNDGKIVFLGVWIAVLTLIQIGFGGLTVLSGTAVSMATAHVATGALILASSVALTVLSYRGVRSEFPAVVYRKMAVMNQ